MIAVAECVPALVVVVTAFTFVGAAVEEQGYRAAMMTS